ncbi:MAG: hypothetical protein KIT84_29290 [Labilithrix sp.]|nr:hypothetical protein [Labilithrix sp.]MCW5815157.1 hypothetical protein [Labilithrix sp.]
MLVGVFAGAIACSKKTPEPTPVPKAALPPAAAAAAAAVANDQRGGLTPDGKLDPNDPNHGRRKLLGLDTPVYVDGVQVAVFRFGELPPIASTPLPGEGNGREWRIYDYLKGIGVDVDNLKSVHFHGNVDRIASVEGSELRKEPERFTFSFTSGGDTGTPFQRWSGTGLKNEFVAHEIRRVTVYVKKPSAPISKEKQCHVAADGECTDAIPYADGAVAKGTRIYLDGKMVGFVKRRLVTDAMIVGTPSAEPSETTYSVAKLLASMNVDPTNIKSLEMWAGDDVIARASGDQVTALTPKTTFTLPKHNHGKVRIRVPAEIQAAKPGVADRDALVSAVLVYRSTTPPSPRDLTAISEDTDMSVQLAAIDDARGKLGRAE